MTTPAPVYIAAPLGADSPSGVKANIRRAESLGRIAADKGFAPLVVHSNAEALYGSDAQPEARLRGLAGSVAILEIVARHPQGALWVLTRHDGSLSAGCAAEVERWKALRPDSPPVVWNPRRRV